MSNAGIFIVGTVVTLIVFAAFGVLAFGIMLDRRDLIAADEALSTPPVARPGVLPLFEPGTPSAAANALSTPSLAAMDPVDPDPARMPAA